MSDNFKLGFLFISLFIFIYFNYNYNYMLPNKRKMPMFYFNKNFTTFLTINNDSTENILNAKQFKVIITIKYLNKLYRNYNCDNV
jgi:hypothetical protein